MKLKTNWTCPACGQAIPIRLDALSGADGSRLKIRVVVADAGLADAFAHAWTHEGLHRTTRPGEGK